MFTNNRSETIAPQKGVEKLIDINKELAELGAIKANLEVEIKEGQSLAAEYHGLDEKVAEKDVELQKLNNEIKKAKIKVEDVASLKQKDIELRKIIEKLQNEIGSLLADRVSISKDITTLNNNKSTKEAELQSVVLGLNEKLSKLKNEFIAFEKKAIAKVDEYDGELSVKNLELNKLATKVIDREKELKSLTFNCAKLSFDIKSLNISREEATSKLVTETERANTKYDERMVEFEVYKNAETFKLDKRDGKLSDKARFLDVRENFLRSVKEQLEDKLGKKIDNLVF